MLRYLLDANRGAADRVPLREELDFVRDYLELESLRLGSRLAVVWRIDEVATDDTVPPLTLQPLVENAIVHGIAPRTETGTVHIECTRLAPPRPAARVRGDARGLLLAAGRAAAAAAAWASTRCAPLPARYSAGALRLPFAPGQGFCVEIVLPLPNPTHEANPP